MKIRNLVASVLIGSGFLLPLKSFCSPQEIFKKTFPVEMPFVDVYPDNINPSSSLEKKTANITIHAFYDDEAKILSFMYSADGYDRKDWSNLEKRSPLWERYTEMNDSTEIYIIAPKEVEVSDTKEQSYVVEEDAKGEILGRFKELYPLEEHPYLQLAFDLAGKELDKLVKKLGVKNLQKIVDSWEKSMENANEQKIKDVKDEINSKYTATQIPLYPLGSWEIETARKYEISLSSSSSKEEPVSVWLKINAGNPAVYSNYGELSDITINFIMNQKKTDTQTKQNSEKKDSKEQTNSIDSLFPKTSEFRGIMAFPMHIPPTQVNNPSAIKINEMLMQSNPYFFSQKDMNDFNPGEGINAMAIGSYYPEKEDGTISEVCFLMSADKCTEDAANSEMYDMTKDSQDLTSFELVGDDFHVYFTSFFNYFGIYNNEQATPGQVLNFLKFLANYEKRIKVKRVIMDENDAKGIKRDLENNPADLADRINNFKSWGFKSAEDAINYIFSPTSY